MRWFSNVTGVAVVDRTIWLVGSALDEASGNQLTLSRATPAGGSGWAVGAFDTDTGRNPLAEIHRQ